MDNNNQRSPRRSNRFWLKVAGVGLVAGLIGGGVAVGVGGAVQHHEDVTSTRVPSGSNKSGGTKVNKNKADLNRAGRVSSLFSRMAPRLGCRMRRPGK